MRPGMRKKPRSAEDKFRAAVEAIRGEETTAELCQEYGIISSQLFISKKALNESDNN